MQTCFLYYKMMLSTINWARQRCSSWRCLMIHTEDYQSSLMTSCCSKAFRAQSRFWLTQISLPLAVLTLHTHGKKVTTTEWEMENIIWGQSHRLNIFSVMFLRNVVLHYCAQTKTGSRCCHCSSEDHSTDKVQE